MHTRLRSPNNLLILERDFPCLADEIAERSPDMNIKVAAFTVSEKSINIPLAHTRAFDSGELKRKTWLNCKKTAV